MSPPNPNAKAVRVALGQMQRRWVRATCCGVLSLSALAAPAQEAPLLAKLLERGAELEANNHLEDNAWQAAVQYCQAARFGSTEAQYRLGMLYAFGQGVPENRALAAALFSVAGMQGHAEAAKMLETIEMSSARMPPCVALGELPVKKPKPAVLPAPKVVAVIRQPIDDVLADLPQGKQWVIELAHSLSNWYALDPKLVLSVIAVESNFNHKAQSHKAAQGLMQLIPGTADRFNVKNAFDASQNLRGGMRYLRWLLSRYQGNLTYTLAAYNAGEGRVDRYKGVPPYPETRNYVEKVLDLYGLATHRFEDGLAEAAPWMPTPAQR